MLHSSTPRFQEEKLLFLQFPDTLPIKPLSHDSDVPGDIQENQDSTSTASSFIMHIIHYLFTYLVIKRLLSYLKQSLIKISG